MAALKAFLFIAIGIGLVFAVTQPTDTTDINNWEDTFGLFSNYVEFPTIEFGEEVTLIEEDIIDLNEYQVEYVEYQLVELEVEYQYEYSFSEFLLDSYITSTSTIRDKRTGAAAAAGGAGKIASGTGTGTGAGAATGTAGNSTGSGTGISTPTGTGTAGNSTSTGSSTGTSSGNSTSSGTSTGTASGNSTSTGTGTNSTIGGGTSTGTSTGTSIGTGTGTGTSDGNGTVAGGNNQVQPLNQASSSSNTWMYIVFPIIGVGAIALALLSLFVFWPKKKAQFVFIGSPFSDDIANAAAAWRNAQNPNNGIVFFRTPNSSLKSVLSSVRPHWRSSYEKIVIVICHKGDHRLGVASPYHDGWIWMMNHFPQVNARRLLVYVLVEGVDSDNDFFKLVETLPQRTDIQTHRITNIDDQVPALMDAALSEDDVIMA